MREQPLAAIRRGQPFRAALRDLALTSNQVWGLAKTDDAWSTALDAALMATRRGDLQHGTTAAYVRGCACKECREHQRERMAKKPLTTNSAQLWIAGLSRRDARPRAPDILLLVWNAWWVRKPGRSSRDSW